MPKFIVHEHHSKKLHWDLRLEVGDVLRSWAVPKGLSLDAKEKRLAIEVEDHDLEYGDYEGIIPEGYGAGAVIIWDRGDFVSVDPPDAKEGLRKGNLKLRLGGKIVQGEFSFIKMQGPGREKAWLLIKKKDAEAKDGWKTPVLLTPEREKGLKVKVPNCQLHD